MNRTNVGVLALILFISVGGVCGPDPSGRCTIEPMAASDGADANLEHPPGPIRLSFQMHGSPVPGQPLEVVITVASLGAAGPLTGKVYGHDGLIVSPAGFSHDGLETRESAERIVTVTPYVSGALRFSVLVQGEVEGEAQAAQLTVPVDVGDSTAQRMPIGTLSTDGSGVPIVTLPARNR